MKVFVDTSALVAILDAGDVRHREASAIFRSVVGTVELITHNYVHIEALAVIRPRLGADAARSLVEDLLPMFGTVWVDQSVHAAALAANRARGGTTSLVDEVSFIVMRANGVETAFAYGGEFEAEGFKRPSVMPAADPGHRLSEPRAQYGTVDVDGQDLVSVSEMAIRAGRPVNTIQSWRRRHPDFPMPVARLAAGPVWLWPAVGRWIEARTTERSRRKRTRRGEQASLPVPAGSGRTVTGEPMPDVVGLIRRSRDGH